MLLQFLNQLKLKNLKMLLNNLFKNKMKLNLSKSQKQNNSNSQALITMQMGISVVIKLTTKKRLLLR